MTTPEIPAQKVFIRTLGCQMNEYDSEKMLALLARDGYTQTDSPEGADLILINTCSVREKPEQKLRSFVGEMREHRARGAKVGIAGCMAQHAGEELFQRFRQDVDLVFGPDHVPRVRELVERSKTERVLENSLLDAEDYPFVQALSPESKGRVSAFVTIQKGCDNKCTFCIVPITRGIEVSRPSGQILAEVRGLVEQGVREITLIGQNVNSYGLKLPGELRFAELLYAVAEVPGVQRIRYTTSHPRDIGADVIEAYRAIPQLTSHLHLPVQSGSDRVLRRMKRFYRREDYLRIVDALRAARPDISLTTDIITGFPGETDEDFEQTMTLLDEVGFDNSFSFCYSPRPNTPAMKLLDDAVPEPVAKARLARFQKRQQELTLASNRAMEGQTYDVLVEGPSRWDPKVVCGRTSSFKMINFPGDSELLGATVPVRVLRGFTNTLRGERLL